MNIESNDLPTNFLNSESDIQLEIIKLGTFIYFNGYRLFNIDTINNERNSLEQSYNLLNEQLSKNFNKIIESEKEQLTTYYTNLQCEIKKSFEKQLESQLSNHQFLLSQLKSENDELKIKNSQLFEEFKESSRLAGKIESLLGKKNDVHNAAKGDFGESLVQTQISYFYPQSTMDDVSGDTAKGDLLWKLLDDSFKCLIEVKNVQYVRRNDVEKFERDLKINLNNDTCNCGLFVSLKTDAIQSKGCFHFEFFEGVPVIYVSNIIQNTNILRIACEILIDVQQMMSKYKETNVLKKDEIKESFQNLVSSILPLLLHSSKNISGMKQSCEDLLQSIKIQESNINQSIHTTLNAQNAHSWMASTSSNNMQNTKKDVIINAIIEFYRNNNTFPNKNQLKDYANSTWFRGENKLDNLIRQAKQLLNMIQ